MHRDDIMKLYGLDKQTIRPMEKTETQKHMLAERMGTTVTPVRLRRDAGHIVVDVEIGGQWREVIREPADAEFCHVWEGKVHD